MSGTHPAFQPHAALERLPMFEPLDAQVEDRRSTVDVLYHKGVQSYLLKPKSWPARLVCLAIWAITAVGLAGLSWWLVPLFLKHVVNPIQEEIEEEWSPVAAAALVMAGVAVVPVVLLPAGPFIWLAAVSLGVWKGYLVVQLGTAFGMSLSYFLGKHFLRQRISKWVERKEWAQALFIAVKEAGPFKVILLMRLGPAPYAWLSYACSLSTDIHFLPYIAASVIGRSPHNLIDIYIGSGVSTAGEAARGMKLDPWLLLFYAIGFVLAVGISVWGYVYAKRVLRDLRARAVARDQVLTAFSFPELEEFDEVDIPVLRADSLKALDGSGRYADLELVGVDSEDAAPETYAPGRMSKPRESSPRKEARLSQESEETSQYSRKGGGTHVRADCSSAVEDEGSSLMKGQSHSA